MEGSEKTLYQESASEHQAWVEPRQRDAEADPVAADPVGWNRRVSQLRHVEDVRGDEATLSVTFGEAVSVVNWEAAESSQPNSSSTR